MAGFHIDDRLLSSQFRIGQRVVLIQKFGDDKMLGVVEAGSVGTVCTNPIDHGQPDGFYIGIHFDERVGGILTFQNGYAVYINCRDLMILNDDENIEQDGLPPISDLL